MAKKSLDSQNFQALLQLNLLDVVGVSDKKEEEQIEYLQKFSELVWTLFFRTEGKDVPKEDLEKIADLFEKKKFEELDKYFKEKFPELQSIISAKTLIAKELIISQHLGKLLFILENSKLPNKESMKDELRSLIGLVEKKKWEDFAKNYKFLDKIRENLND